MNKEIARIGRRVVTLAIGLIHTPKTIYRTTECWSDCPFSTEPCENECSWARIAKREERKIFRIRKETKWDEKRLSRSQLLQFIMLHFYPVDENGFVKNIDIPALAEALRIHTKTVRANFVVLDQLGFLSYSATASQLYQVWLREYRTYHATKEQGGTGYLQISQEFLQTLIKSTSVNEIRLRLRLYLRHEDEVVRSDQQNAHVAYRELKSWLPSHVGYPKAWQPLLMKMNHMLHWAAETTGIRFRFIDKIIGKWQRPIKEEELAQLLAEHYPHLSHEMTSLVTLGMEYGWESLTKVLDDAFAEDKAMPVHTWGAFIRSRLRLLTTPS